MCRTFVPTLEEFLAVSHVDAETSTVKNDRY